MFSIKVASNFGVTTSFGIMTFDIIKFIVRFRNIQIHRLDIFSSGSQGMKRVETGMAKNGKILSFCF